ncbi:YoaK family protein [Maridesulfovibrio frigidus]|uniref:membrane protein n=1 Tax=Maridesulfovibrio frigidus TaxID=340956 RepID=UPI0004E1CE2C|nr:membrane protein [Maridesulfovibrio frigidus]
MSKNQIHHISFICILLICLIILPASILYAQSENNEDLTVETKELDSIENTSMQTATLTNLLYYKSELLKQASLTKEAMKNTSHPEDKKALLLRLNDLKKQLKKVTQNFIKVATGLDTAIFNEEIQQNFQWQEEIETLVKPILYELKEMTKRPRQVERLKSRVAYFESKLPRAKEAVASIEELIASTDSLLLKAELDNLKIDFLKKRTNISNQLDVAHFELNELQKEKTSLFESTKKVMAVFFKSRGKNILIALLAFAGVFLFFRIIDRGFRKIHPAFKAKQRPFYIRIFEIVLLFISVLAATLASLFTLYTSGDWFLLSIALIFLLGALWTARAGFTRYYEQVKLILNLGAVRENERIVHNGVPWKVDRLQIYAKLRNPVLSPSTIRLPIRELENLISRPIGNNEPWFPCRKNDWVILSDGVRGKVISQSPDMVELLQRGGAYVTYQTPVFLGLNPLNISRNFRIKSVFGIDYAHQAKSTTSILEQAKNFISTKLEEDGYSKHVLNLKVEFESAGASSLNLVIIADFHSDIAELYGRLTRALQRYSVDACNHFEWNIPFAQLVVHKAK